MAAVEIPNYVKAFFSFTAANPPVRIASQGFAAALVRNGAGDYTLTLDDDIAPADTHVRVTQQGAVAAFAVAQRDAVNANEVDVLAFSSAGAGADTANVLLVEVIRFPTT